MSSMSDLPGIRWCADYLPCSRDPSPRHSRPKGSEHMCGRVVLADARGHVVSRFGFTYIVQDDHGQRAHGFSDADLACGDRCVFDIVVDSQAGSRLRIASKIRRVTAK